VLGHHSYLFYLEALFFEFYVLTQFGKTDGTDPYIICYPMEDTDTEDTSK